MKQGHLLALPLGSNSDSNPYLRHGEDPLGKGIETLLGQGLDLQNHALHSGTTGNQAVGAFLVLVVIDTYAKIIDVSVRYSDNTIFTGEFDNVLEIRKVKMHYLWIWKIKNP